MWPLTALVLATCGGPAPGEPIAPKAAEKPGAIALDAEQGARILVQCARNTPAGGRVFEPARAEVEAADAAIAAFYEAVADEVSAYYYEPFETFQRQYVGVVVEGRRQIYANAFQRSAAEDPTAPFDSCEEGPRFFGAQYDVEAGDVVDLEFNSADDYRFFIDVEDFVREGAETRETVSKYRRFTIDTGELDGIEPGHGFEFAFVYDIDRGDRSKSLYFLSRERAIFGMVSLTYSVNRFDVLAGRVLHEADFLERNTFRGDQSALRDEIFPPAGVAPARGTAGSIAAIASPVPGGELDPCALLAAQLAEQEPAARPAPRQGSFEHKARQRWFDFELPGFLSDAPVDWKRFFTSYKRAEQARAREFKAASKSQRGPQTSEEDRAFAMLEREFRLVARPRVYEALRAAACYLTIFQDPAEPFPFPGGPWSTPEDNARYLPTVREEYAEIADAIATGERLDEAVFEDPAPRRGMVGLARIPFGPAVEPPDDKRQGWGPARNEIVFSWHGQVMPVFNGPVFERPDPVERPGPGGWIFYKLVAAYSESHKNRPL